jgi:hypothetical protein
MKRDKEFNNILDECLERLLAKDKTIEQCLLRYPEYAAELEPLLQTVVATKKAVAIQPRPEFKSEARHQFRLALQKIESKRRLSFLGWQPRWAIAVVALLVVLLGGGGTVAAAGNSMPDGLLYPVKLATEQVRLSLTFSDIGRAELYAELADERVAEMVYVVNKGKPERVEPTAERLNKHLASIVSLSLADEVVVEVKEAESEEARVMLAPAAEASVMEEDTKGEPDKEERALSNEKAELKTLLERNAANHLTALRALLKTAPESAKPVLHQTINELADSYEIALQALD